jgi:hypothetical protein
MLVTGPTLSLSSLSPLVPRGEREFIFCAFDPGRRLSDSPLPWAVMSSPFQGFGLARYARKWTPHPLLGGVILLV